MEAWNDHEEVVRVCRKESRKAKVYLKLNLAKDMKDKKIFQYIKNKMKKLRIMWTNHLMDGGPW